MGNKPTYIVFDDVLRDKGLRKYFDVCIKDVQEGKARVSRTRAKAGYPSWPCFRVEGHELLVEAVLNYYLFELQLSGFVSRDAEHFTDKMRVLCGWHYDVDRVLSKWIERLIITPFFYDENDNKYNHKWVLKPENQGYTLSEEHLKFACFIAVCFTKYGHSFDKNYTKEVFDLVTALGSKLPAQIKKNGSGSIPKEIAECKTEDFSCTSNDAFAIIKISVKNECEEIYSKALDYLCKLFEYGFSPSYSIEFKSSNKIYLPIKKIPKKGVNQFFANAILYPEIHDKIERYARLVMKEFEWYLNLNDEFCAMPGSFAVFALGLYDEKYHRLVCDYLAICDGEHQSIQGEFVLAYIEKFGFTEKGLELYKLCEENMQELPKKLVSLYKKSAR
ncbi:DUF6138 family protein [Mogibacterium pumilum]|uniref:Uncharacterized protein n=1 Tax=Mogibacterium pumilum TaxID=86332 RepID=A0A223ASN6_9FIRM|nr:DUF6138 family protein [Mogibacterium pumilum]ASS37925.1 hypothetical protein AXF17_05415 [Mogibacterium pumilum]